MNPATVDEATMVAYNNENKGVAGYLKLAFREGIFWRPR
jgi:hypothetical protein